MAAESQAAPQNMINLLSPERRQAMIAIFGEKMAKSYQGPLVFVDNATLSSPTALHFFNREFQFLSKVLHYEYQYRSWVGYDQSLLDRYRDMIEKKLSSIATMLDNNQRRFNVLLEQNGSSLDGAVYGTALQTSVPITSGHARQYFNILKALDQLFLTTGAANMMGIITSTQRAEAEKQAKKAVRAFGAALRQEVYNLYREGNRVQKQQQDRGDHTHEEAIAQQGQEIAAFGEAIDQDAKRDESLNLGGVDPSQVIDDANAAAAATANAAGKGPGKGAKKPAPAKTATEAAA